MAISLNTDFLNRFIAPGISEFTACDAPDITAAHPEASHWLANHFLNSILRAAFKDKYRQYALNQIFRAQTAFHDYHEARSLTADFLANSRPGLPARRTYFRAVARWESCFLNLQIFMDLMNKMKQDFKDEPVFKKGDESPEQRAYAMTNTIKHWGSAVAASRHAVDDTIPLWLTNAGLQTRLYRLTYTELARLVSEVAAVANELQDPKSFADAK